MTKLYLEDNHKTENPGKKYIDPVSVEALIEDIAHMKQTLTDYEEQLSSLKQDTKY